MTAWLVLLLGAAPLCTESTRVLFFDGLPLSRPYEVAALVVMAPFLVSGELRRALTRCTTRGTSSRGTWRWSR